MQYTTQVWLNDCKAAVREGQVDSCWLLGYCLFFSLSMFHRTHCFFSIRHVAFIPWRYTKNKKRGSAVARVRQWIIECFQKKKKKKDGFSDKKHIFFISARVFVWCCRHHPYYISGGGIFSLRAQALAQQVWQLPLRQKSSGRVDSSKFHCTVNVEANMLNAPQPRQRRRTRRKKKSRKKRCTQMYRKMDVPISKTSWDKQINMFVFNFASFKLNLKEKSSTWNN